MSGRPLKGDVERHRGLSGLGAWPVRHLALVVPLLMHVGHFGRSPLETRHRVGDVNDMDLVSAVFAQDAAEDLLEPFAEMFGDESVHDGVDAGVSVSHAVRQKSEGVGDLVEGEISVKIAQDNHMIRQPANTEKHSHDNDHFSDFAFRSFGLGHPVERIHSRPQVFDGSGVGHADDKHRDHVPKHKSAGVQYFTVLPLPPRDADRAVVELDEVIVAQIGAGEDQRQTPDDHHGNHSVTRGAELAGTQRVTDGQVSVDRDCGQCEAAGVHGEVDEEMHHFAHEGPEHPALQGVDCSLERHTEDDEEEIGDAQVEDEEVGGVVSQLATPQQHGQDQAVPDGAQQKYQREDHGDDDAGGVELVTVGHVVLALRFDEVLEV